MHVYLTAHQPGSVQLFPSTFLVLALVWYSSSHVLQEQSVCTEHSPPLTISRGKGMVLYSLLTHEGYLYQTTVFFFRESCPLYSSQHTYLTKCDYSNP